MTACATETTVPGATPRPGGDEGAHGAVDERPYTLSSCGSLAARLHRTDGGWRVERWTLRAPEPYPVSLPVPGAAEPGDEALPLPDGRVVLRRRAAGGQRVSLLCPGASATVERPLAAVPVPALRLLPTAPDGTCLYALEPGAGASAVWLLAGEPGGPRRVAQLPGRCSGGVWLDRAGRLLAVEQEHAGAVRTVTVDLARDGATAPLLEIGERSTDRLLHAEQDSGLLLIGSDAASPGRERLAWGVLGSGEPVRFPECLALPEHTVSVLSVRGGGEAARCAVALRVEGADGTSVALWRPAGRAPRRTAVPAGWLDGVTVWGRDGSLGLPCAGGTGVLWLAEPSATAHAPRPVPLREAPLARPVAAGTLAAGPVAAQPVAAGPVAAGSVAAGSVAAGPC